MSSIPRAKKKATPVAFNTGDQPVRTPPGLPYGERQQLTQGQSQIPLPTQPNLTSVPTGPAAQGPPPDQNALLAAAQGHQFNPVPLVAPTNRPGEPVTTGLASGPGAGPDQGTDPQTLDVLAWKPYLPALEFMASQPGATMSTRQFVRRLRSLVPVTPPVGTAPPGPQ